MNDDSKLISYCPSISSRSRLGYMNIPGISQKLINLRFKLLKVGVNRLILKKLGFESGLRISFIQIFNLFFYVLFKVTIVV
jgi:hypothetical protein